MIGTFPVNVLKETDRKSYTLPKESVFNYANERNCASMRGHTGSYRHFIPQLNLSIERGTARVPSDGRFYLIRDGVIIDSFRSIKKAEEKSKQLVRESGFRLETDKRPINAIEESMERYQMTKDIFWAEGPKHRKTGGRGGRGGV